MHSVWVTTDNKYYVNKAIGGSIYQGRRGGSFDPFLSMMAGIKGKKISTKQKGAISIPQKYLVNKKEMFSLLGDEEIKRIALAVYEIMYKSKITKDCRYLTKNEDGTYVCNYISSRCGGCSSITWEDPS